MNYSEKEIKDLYKELKTDEKGLTPLEVSSRLNKYGKNELPKGKKDGILKLFFSQFENPIELILVVTVVLSFIAGEVIDACALIFIIAVDVIMGTYQEWKARKDADALASMIKTMARVIRNGNEVEIDSSDVVPGDILVLESGVNISADARIIDCHNFQTNESSLTGESLGIVKTNEVLKGDLSLGDRKNMVFAGTSVITGRAHAVVVGTGIHTEIGKIADKVNSTKEEKSPLTIRIEKFSKQITVLIIIIAIITAGVLIYKQYPVNEIFLCVIALSVSAMPEGLPLALTMALTIASKKMAKKNVIVKDLNAVESLGSCTVIASDKTGTLTVNEQTAKEIHLADGSKFLISGTGYNGDGEVTPVDGADINAAKELALLGKINNEATLEKKNGTWTSFGDSIDIAFLAMAHKLKVNDKVEIVETIPYESENQYSAVFYKRDGKLRCTVKGSLEKIMDFSEKRELYTKQNEELTSNGYRVIALADGEVDGTTEKDIKSLIFVGMVAFIDPVREDVKESLKECEKAGIKVCMVTGDHPLTAFAIAKDLNLVSSMDEVATGVEVNEHLKKGEKAFDEFVKKIRVFSRVTPVDKLEIVNSFKRQGEFVAVTGDGVNDAPAIKAANIGISMGSGTDVAKETASMIITNDNFTSIVEGVKEGRTAYSNIRKITLFLLGCGLAEVFFFLLSIVFGFDIPLLAIQLLWLNVVTDGLQDMALSFEPTENSIMNNPPRRTDESLFSKDLMIEVSILGLTITTIVFGLWYFLMSKGVDVVLARSYIMMLMVIIQNINVFNCKSEKKSVFATNIFNNWYVLGAIVISIGMQLVFDEIPITSTFLKVVPLPLNHVAAIFGLSLIVIAVFEVYKLILKVIKSKSQK